MSLRINKDNIHVILPKNHYIPDSKIDDAMEGDFTLYAKVKIHPEILTGKESFIIARNGMHSGISAFKDSLGSIIIQYTYWFENTAQGNSFVKQVQYQMTEHEVEHYIQVYMVNDMMRNKIECYFNGRKIGLIDYDGLKKVSYENSPFWLGCGGMISDSDNQNIGDFDFDLAFCIKKKLYQSTINDVVNKYNTEYSKVLVDDLRCFHDYWYLANLFVFFCDFKTYNKYKIWNYVYNGNYPQVYMKDNIYY
jgi:hypothetical protein